MEISLALEHSQPGLVARLTVAFRQHELNYRSEQIYLHWISRFVLFHGMKDPSLLEENDRRTFLEYLMDQVQVSRARQNQATQALTFLYSEVLNAQTSRGIVAA